MSDEEQISGQDKRLQKILFLLRKRDKVSVNELSTLFNVSRVTVRADLAELERQGLILRNYGGASLMPEGGPTGTREAPGRDGGQDARPAATERVESRAIALLAADLVNEGDSIFLDASPESRILAELIKDRSSLAVVTVSLEVALILARSAGIETHIAGGRISADGLVIPDLDILSDEEIWPFEALGVSKAFVGAWGATEADGFGEKRREDAALKRAVLARAGERYAFLRSTRWRAKTLCSFTPLEGVDAVLTDSGAGAEMVDAFASRKVRLLKASPRARTEGAYPAFYAFRSNAAEGLTYIGSPGKGKRLAFANGNRSEPFCACVEAGVLRNAALAGFADDDVLVLDNGYDPERAVENAQRIAEWGADVAIQFNTDVRSNNLIADLFREEGVLTVAMEGAVPSAPFVGANNWRAGSAAGDCARDLIASKLGGWGAVRAVILVEMSTAGELVLLRTEAFAASLEAAFGEETEKRIIRIEGGNQYGTSLAAVAAAAGSLPKDGKYVLTAVNAEAMSGAVDALRSAGVWSADRFVSVVHGEESTVRPQLDGGIVDAAILYHPERYGEAAVSAACAAISGAAVPPYAYIDSSLVLKDGGHRSEA